MKKRFLLLSFFVGLYSFCLGMEQENKYSKIEESALSGSSLELQGATIPSLLELVKARVILHVLEDLQIQGVYEFFTVTCAEIPEDIILPLIVQVVAENNVRKKYDPVQLALAIVECCLTRASWKIDSKASVPFDKQLEQIEKRGKECRCLQSGHCSFEHLASTLLSYLLDDPSLQDLGELRPLALATLHGFDKTAAALIRKLPTGEQMMNRATDIKQAVRQLLHARKDQKACELIKKVPIPVLGSDYPHQFTLLDYAQFYGCPDAAKLLRTLAMQESLAYGGIDKCIYPAPYYHYGLCMGHSKIVSDYLDKLTSSQNSISVKDIKLPGLRSLPNSSAIGLLSHAMLHSFDSMIKMLIEKGVPVNDARIWQNVTPLTYACLKNNLALATLILSKEIKPDLSIQCVRGSALHIACENGNLPLVTLLLNNWADINQKVCLQQPAVQQAPSVPQKMSQVPLGVSNQLQQQLLQQRQYQLQILRNAQPSNAQVRALAPKLEQEIKKLESQLPKAVEKSQPTTTPATNKGPILGATKVIEGDTPLHIACLKGDLDIASLLLKRGAKKQEKNSRNELPLHLACITSNSSLVEVLLSGNVAALAEADKFANTPFHKVCESRKSEEIAQLLLDQALRHKIDIFKQNLFCMTPFLLACKAKSNELIKKLLGFGAAVSTINNNQKQNALHLYLAVASDEDASCIDLSIVKSLLELQNMHVNAQDGNGNTPLHTFMNYNWSVNETKKNVAIQVLDLLFSRGALAHIGNHEGCTLLHLVCQKTFDTVLAELLLKKGAYVDVPDHAGNTPLHYVCKNAHNESLPLLKLLVESGAHVNYSNKSGATPLSSCLFSSNSVGSFSDRLQCADYLINKGADTSITDMQGNSLLNRACLRQDIELAQYLLKLGLSPLAPNKAGKTALDIAQDSKNEEITSILLDHITTMIS
jgi:ankyrin repeat protein